MNQNLAYREDAREELIGGEIFAMSPRPAFNHNRVALNIVVLFENYLKGKSCTSFADGTDLFLTEKDHFVPDVMVVCDPGKIKQNGVHGAPDLVVEVLSRSTVKNDRGRKMKVYAQCGVREYWIVDPENKSIEQYLPAEGQFELHAVYAVHADWELEQMTEQERAEVETHFKCSLFEDLDIAVEDVFYRTF